MALTLPALAHPSPPSSHPVAIESGTENFRLPPPHCEHGHGWERANEALLRADRPDVDTGTPHDFAVGPQPPRVETTIGQPSRQPLLASLPLYLLTQRLRP
ncbi:hypothetical protein [Halomonas sp. MCCC 1A11057]|uniref:hypothetical protein n=1 Tax=Halomonas sp. MCCC 1A11057 TaxID=2733482 RepID=UPI001F15DB75|nr:hypothetical protein [Halomonas sp. MCCC 1A11057]MCE8032616.1 hypothetical protein [Halomonas sp. MCCC 1A11057]